MPSRTVFLFAPLVALMLAGCTGGGGNAGGDGLAMQAFPPRAGDAVDLVIVDERAVMGAQALLVIHHEGEQVYPHDGLPAAFALDGLATTARVPYAEFVVANGPYEAIVTQDGREARAQFTVQKWVDGVFLRAFPTGDDVRLEMALTTTTPVAADDRVFASGELQVELRWRGADEAEDELLDTFVVETSHENASTSFLVDASSFTRGSGWYSFEPSFDNAQARGNVEVGPDADMLAQEPRPHWVQVHRAENPPASDVEPSR